MLTISTKLLGELVEDGTSLEAQLVKNLPAMQETWVQSLGWGDSLEKESLLTPVFWPGEFRVLYSLWVTESWTRLVTFTAHTGEDVLDPFFTPSSKIGFRLKFKYK